MDKKWADFLGRRGEARDQIEQGKMRASQGLGAMDSAITQAVTMGMGSGGGAAAAGATPPATANPGVAGAAPPSAPAPVDNTEQYGGIDPDPNYGYNPGYGG